MSTRIKPKREVAHWTAAGSLKLTCPLDLTLFTSVNGSWLATSLGIAHYLANSASCAANAAKLTSFWYSRLDALILEAVVFRGGIWVHPRRKLGESGEEMDGTLGFY